MPSIFSSVPVVGQVRQFFVSKLHAGRPWEERVLFGLTVVCIAILVTEALAMLFSWARSSKTASAAETKEGGKKEKKEGENEKAKVKVSTSNSASSYAAIITFGLVFSTLCACIGFMLGQEYAQKSLPKHVAPATTAPVRIVIPPNEESCAHITGGRPVDVCLFANGASSTEPLLQGTFSHFAQFEAAVDEYLHAHESATYYLLPYQGYQFFIDFTPAEAWEFYGKGVIKVPGSDCQPVFIVPSHRPFHWPTFGEAGIGTTWKVQNVTITVMAASPPVFIFDGFISHEEAEAARERSLDPKRPEKLQESTTGFSTNAKNNRKSGLRTSMNGWDTGSPFFSSMMTRMFHALGMESDRSAFDGLQVVRYTTKQAYVKHSDHFSITTNDRFNWDPSTPGGSNRYATIFVYLHDMQDSDGGQTVFNHAKVFNKNPPFDRDPSILEQGRQRARDLFDDADWELGLSMECLDEDILAVLPKRGRASMFYHQDPMTGQMHHKLAEHGACPILSEEGLKWGMNAWIWNGPRYLA